MQFDLQMPSQPKSTPIPNETLDRPEEPDTGLCDTSAPETLSDNSTPCRRTCESEPGYNWRTDPYYNEESIRERLKAAKAKNTACQCE